MSSCNSIFSRKSDSFVESNLVSITVSLDFRDIQKKIEFEIHKSRAVADVYDKIHAWLKRDDILPQTVKFKNFTLKCGSEILS